ncbi:arginase family protein [Aquimarina hainanensis]|uniref:arginase family protein n=1 Tax=Aquimarina hainanensis TaxID=1578017 RepID=UPI00360FE9F0
MKLKTILLQKCDTGGFEQCVKEAIERLDACDVVYVSFDVDSMDCDLISKGTGTPVSKGFDIEESYLYYSAIYRNEESSLF